MVFLTPVRARRTGQSVIIFHAKDVLMPSTVGAGLGEGREDFSFAKKRQKRSFRKDPRGDGEGVDDDKIPRDFRAMNVDELPRGPLC